MLDPGVYATFAMWFSWWGNSYHNGFVESSGGCPQTRFNKKAGSNLDLGRAFVQSPKTTQHTSAILGPFLLKRSLSWATKRSGARGEVAVVQVATKRMQTLARFCKICKAEWLLRDNPRWDMIKFRRTCNWKSSQA